MPVKWRPSASHSSEVPSAFERRQQLREHLVAERGAVQPDVEEAHVGEPLAERLGLAAVVGVQHQPADLGRAVVVVADAQHLVDEVLVERLGVALVLHDVEEDVRRAPRAVLRVDHRGADDLLLRVVDEDEQVLALEDVELAVEGLARLLDQLLEDARDRRAGSRCRGVTRQRGALPSLRGRPRGSGTFGRTLDGKREATPDPGARQAAAPPGATGGSVSATACWPGRPARGRARRAAAASACARATDTRS